MSSPLKHNGILLNIRFDIENKVAAFAAALPNHTVIDRSTDKRAGADMSEVKYAVVWKPEHGLMKSLPNLEVIFSLGAGVDHVFEDTDLPDVPIVRFVDEDLTGRMVEYVVLQVLMHLRQQRHYDALQRKAEWRELIQPAAQQFRVGIMGFGELGQACVKGLLPLGFSVNGWSRSPKVLDGVKSFYGDDQLNDFLGQSDILVSLLPYTPATHGILNADLIDKLAKDGPFGAPVIINAGRGGSQVEGDIIAALKSGALHGVSLDVFETEPLAHDSPLWAFENAILTPHMAAVSDPSALSNHVARQIARYESGQPLEHVVDPKVGY